MNGLQQFLTQVIIDAMLLVFAGALSVIVIWALAAAGRSAAGYLRRHNLRPRIITRKHVVNEAGN